MKDKILLEKKGEYTDLEQFAGEWVAFYENKIVGHSKALEGLMRSMRSRSFKKKPSVLLVPRREEGPYILIL